MTRLAGLRQRTDEMVEALRALVEVESPSSDRSATATCVEVTDKIALDLLGESGEQIVVDGRTHLRWRFGSPTKVVLLGHLDTVWPLGTLDRWPFSVDGDNATGPGCFDMKGGVVQLLFALSALEDLDGVAVVLTTDEELGSPTGRGVIQETVLGAGAVLVLEPSAAGALKTERKGTSAYSLRVTGRAAHAGLDPEKGVNSVVELAHQVLAIAELARPDLGTTVTPSVVTAGSTSNTVPAAAMLDIDVRAFTVEEQERVHAALGDLHPVFPGASLRVERVATVPPLERTASESLFPLARRLASDLGLPPLEETAVGGASDGNFTASLGIPTLDGLGALGGGAHAEGEWLSVSAMPERAALVGALVEELRS